MNMETKLEATRARAQRTCKNIHLLHRERRFISWLRPSSACPLKSMSSNLRERVRGLGHEHEHGHEHTRTRAQARARERRWARTCSTYRTLCRGIAQTREWKYGVTSFPLLADTSAVMTSSPSRRSLVDFLLLGASRLNSTFMYLDVRDRGGER